jgi:hypothetical protein
MTLFSAQAARMLEEENLGTLFDETIIRFGRLQVLRNVRALRGVALNILPRSVV